jgi:Na+/H+ antiporter NhaD/arsenite permease-like protein
MVGAVPLVAGYVAMLFGLIGQHSALAGLSAVLVAVFEFSLGIYLVVKGFRPSGITAGIQMESE